MSSEAGLAKLSTRLDKLYEFEREPVTPDKLQDGRYFAAMFAGEHVAGTEFVIGALFVQWGAGARDLIVGLLIGNLLAVLSWAFICAPIAVRVRLTLYWYVRRIIGPGLTVIFNLVNTLLFCCLAAAMIGVSASAVGMGISKFGVTFRHPELSDIYPNSIEWVVIVLLVGVGVTFLAIAGFKRFSQFSAVCAPWMFPIFIAGAIASLPKLGEFHNLSQLWAIADERIWTGVPAHGGTRLGLWHVIFFAWFCNLATHIGLSDMAVFRYARRWTYGFYSAFGMYLGHYVAWICAGVMGAVIGAQLNPGRMADAAAGVAGLICVMLAGWTTANPTIYRAGLALQIVTPNWPRWKTTLAAGAVTTCVALFPAIFMRLLDFVAIYGLVLMPIGAIIVAEHWFFPLLGLRPYWTERRNLAINPPALIAWVAVLALCLPIEDFTHNAVRSPMAMLGVHLFFRWLPGWFLSVILYIILCYVTPGARDSRLLNERLTASDRPTSPSTTTRPAARTRLHSMPLSLWLAGGVAVAALLMCVVLPLRVFLQGTVNYEANLGSYKTGLLVVTFIYFIAATYWVAQREELRAA